MPGHDEYRFHVAQKAVVDVYVSASNARIEWPYRLETVEEARESTRQTAVEYILDSGMGHGTAPAEILDEAERRDADYVIPDDQLADREKDLDKDAIHTTADETARFLDEAARRDFDGTILIPLQPPHDHHYRYLCSHFPRQAQHTHFCVGGLKGAAPEAQITAVQRLRELVGYEAYLHGLGFGAGREVVDALRTTPRLLDSVDISTPQQNARNGKFAGSVRDQVNFGQPQNTASSIEIGAVGTAELVGIARALAPSLTDPRNLNEPINATADDDTHTITGEADTTSPPPAITRPDDGTDHPSAEQLSSF
ncbi:hypothetical protein RYH80_18235 [Halobaculum sp. MBLA0147]|uniref:hypothetical protein n=1 Tax=Halobaculum sp. MBLA0147 TaxID=3079934 RepID=UPI0035232C81